LSLIKLGLATKVNRGSVPWNKLRDEGEKFLESGSVPHGVILREPSKLRRAELDKLLAHWYDQEEHDDPDKFSFKAYLDGDGNAVPAGSKSAPKLGQQLSKQPKKTTPLSKDLNGSDDSDGGDPDDDEEFYPWPSSPAAEIRKDGSEPARLEAVPEDALGEAGEGALVQPALAEDNDQAPELEPPGTASKGGKGPKKSAAPPSIRRNPGRTLQPSSLHGPVKQVAAIQPASMDISQADNSNNTDAGNSTNDAGAGSEVGPNSSTDTSLKAGKAKSLMAKRKGKGENPGQKRLKQK
jgi:hypothetical protein